MVNEWGFNMDFLDGLFIVLILFLFIEIVRLKKQNKEILENKMIVLSHDVDYEKMIFLKVDEFPYKLMRGNELISKDIEHISKKKSGFVWSLTSKNEEFEVNIFKNTYKIK